MDFPLKSDSKACTVIFWLFVHKCVIHIHPLTSTSKRMFYTDEINGWIITKKLHIPKDIGGPWGGHLPQITNTSPNNPSKGNPISIKPKTAHGFSKNTTV